MGSRSDCASPESGSIVAIASAAVRSPGISVHGGPLSPTPEGWPAEGTGFAKARECPSEHQIVELQTSISAGGSAMGGGGRLQGPADRRPLSRLVGFFEPAEQQG